MRSHRNYEDILGRKLDVKIHRLAQASLDRDFASKVRQDISCLESQACSVYLTGSVARAGKLVRGKDADVVIVAQQPHLLLPRIRVTGAAHTDISKIGLSDIQRSRWHPLKFILFHSGYLIEGSDVVGLYREPRTYLDCVVSCLSFMKDVQYFLCLEPSMQGLLARRVTKRTLRAAFETVMVDARVYTADPADCGNIAATYLSPCRHLLASLTALHEQRSWSKSDKNEATELIRLLLYYLGPSVDRTRSKYLSARLFESAI